MGAVTTTRHTAVAVDEDAQYLTFMLGGEMFAIGILGIKEIIEYGSLTVVPMMPAFVRGVINLRGAVVPVVDLGVRFGLRDSLVTKRTCVIITEVEVGGEQWVMGLLADAVSQVIDLLPADIELPSAFGTRVPAEFLKGLAKVGTESVLILDLDRALAAAQFAPVAEAQDQAVNLDAGGEQTPDGEVNCTPAEECLTPSVEHAQCRE